MFNKVNCILVVLIFSLCALLYTFFASTLVKGSEITDVDYPLFISIDRNLIATGLCLKCDVVDCDGMAYDKYVSDEKNINAKTFKRVVEALSADKSSEVRKLTFKKNNMTAKENEELEFKANSFMSSFQGFHTDSRFGSGFSELKVFNEIYFGNDIYIVYGTDRMDKGERPFRPMMKLRQDGNGVYLNVNNVNQADDSTRFVIQDIVNQMARGKDFKEVGGKKFDYEIVHPGTEGPHQVFLRFNGKKYNLNVRKENIDPSDEVAKVFQRQFELLDISREAVAEVYGGSSKTVYLKEIKRAVDMAKETGSNYLDYYITERRTNDRIIRFILDASPLYIVFYQRAKESMSPKDKLWFQFVYRDPEDGSVTIRNDNVLDFFRQWFDLPEIQELFREIILDTE